MKRTISIAIIAMFILSLVPLAFAEKERSDSESTADASAETSTQATVTVSNEDSGANINSRGARAEKIEQIKEKNRKRLEKIEDLDNKQIEKLSKLEVKNVDKLARLKKERLERLANISEEKIERISELEEDKLERISDLNRTELGKLGALSRAEIREKAKEDIEKLKEELKNIRLVKVKNADELDERNVSDSKMAEFRDRFEKARENFDSAKEELESSRKELDEAVRNRDTNKTIDSGKKFLTNSADALISHLEKVKNKVLESKNIPENQVKSIVDDIDAEIAKINSIKTQVQVATTKEQLKDDAKSLRQEFNKVKSLAKLHAGNIVSSRVEGIVNQGLVLEKRLDSILVKLKDENISIKVSSEVTAFSGKIADSRNSYNQAQTKLSEALDLRAKGEPADSDKIKQLTNEADDLLKQARNSLKEAHDQLQDIVKKIKEASPDAKLSDETEVEVAEEENSTENATVHAGMNSTDSA